jgi:hypothetical protein
LPFPLGHPAGVVFGPDAVIDDQNVEASEALDGGGEAAVFEAHS